MTIATSLPARSLISADQISAAAGDGDSSGQRLTVSTVTEAPGVERERYQSETAAEYAVAAGIRFEPTFTSSPDGSIRWPFPVGVHIGDRFGPRSCAGCSSDHGGQDFNPGNGAPIQSIADGVVSVAENGNGDLGVHLMIDHQIDGQLVTSVYAHMQHGSMGFNVGDTVHAGDILGKTGSTGMSTGPHLHFEIRIGGVAGTKVDPLEWLYAHAS